MASLRSRRTSHSSPSPLKPPASSGSSPQVVKTRRRRSKTVSSVECADSQLSSSGLDRDDAGIRNSVDPGDTSQDIRGAGERLNSSPQKSPGRDTKTGETRPREANKPDVRGATGTSPSTDHLDAELQRQRLFETKAKLEAEMQENTEFLRLLRSRRRRLAKEGEQLRRSVSPEKRPATPKSRFTSPEPEAPPPTRPPSPSPARKACNEAYARMSPLREHYLREQMHFNGTRLRDSQREKEERRQWTEYQERRRHAGSSSPPQGMPPKGEVPRATGDRDRLRREEEMRAEAIRLGNKRLTREEREIIEAWELYQSVWASMFSSPPAAVRLKDLPWPITSVSIAMPQRSRLTAATVNLAQVISSDAVSTFIFSEHHSGDKTKKQRLHEALLRYHPDRFEGRWLERVPEANGERGTVREAVGMVARILGQLLEKEQQA